MLMQRPQLTPLQTRLLATLSALCTLCLVHWALIVHTPSAYAVELNAGHDFNHEWDSWRTVQEQEDIDSSRQTLSARTDAHTIDANDSPNRGNLTAGQTIVWLYTQHLLQSKRKDPWPVLPSDIYIPEIDDEVQHKELRRRADDGDNLDKRQTYPQIVYISINTCSQPRWTGTGEQDHGPPQLTLYIGQPGNQNPGPNSSASQTAKIPLDEGFGAYSFKVNSDIYMAVSANGTLPEDFSGDWTYDIAVSIDDYYHASNTDVPFLYLVDTDSDSALLVTENLTLADANATIFKEWMALPKPLPFTMFANAIGGRRYGLARSYCGLSNVAQITVQPNVTGTSPFVNTSMVTRGGNKPKQQFLVGNMTSSTWYNATLALVGNGAKSGKGVVGGGGTVWQPMSWKTKTDGNCRLLYDLPFCSDVAYAAPSNPSNTTAELKSGYDNYAQQLYQNFTYSLMQIQCNTTNDQRYSLARDCTHCAQAYKQWLCAVTVPRCEDYSNTADFLQPRNVAQAFPNNSMLSDQILLGQFTPMEGAPTLPGTPMIQTYKFSYATNQSRNPFFIDNQIAPGPYKEVLPCEDICYNLVQSCPAALQFSCPRPGRGLERGYAPRPSSNSIIQCNYPGAIYYIDDARQFRPSTIVVLAAAMLALYIAHLQT